MNNIVICKEIGQNQSYDLNSIVMGPGYGQRSLKDIQMQHVFGGAYKNVWDSNSVKCPNAPPPAGKIRENYAPSFNSYQNPYNPYSDIIKLKPL
jgi:hypothetical protein